MSHEEFQSYIKGRMDTEKLDVLRAEFGVSRQTLDNWRNGEKPSRMALALAEKVAQLAAVTVTK